MTPGAADLDWRGVSAAAADVTDGNGEEVAHGGSEDEAAWLDLIGRFEAPAYPGDAPAPWPESENLTGPAGGAGVIPDSGSAPGGPGGAIPPAEGGVAPVPAEDGGARPAPAAEGGTRPTPDGDGGVRPAPASDSGLTSAADSGIRSAPARNDDITLRPPWDAGLPPARAAGSGFSLPSAGSGSSPPRAGNGFTPPPARNGFTPPPAGNGAAPPAPRGGPDADPLADEHFVPPPPPPLPRLPPVQKGAWVALFGGPGYLLVATLAGWSVAGWLAILAIAAFVGGFMTLVLHLGDDRDEDSGPDDGAVV